jgi:hypothetical protein
VGYAHDLIFAINHIETCQFNIILKLATVTGNLLSPYFVALRRKFGDLFPAGWIGGEEFNVPGAE